MGAYAHKKEDIMDLKQAYLTLFAAVADAVDLLESSKLKSKELEALRELLIDAQIKAEACAAELSEQD